jgi:hypothetical protein
VVHESSSQKECSASEGSGMSGEVIKAIKALLEWHMHPGTREFLLLALQNERECADD